MAGPGHQRVHLAHHCVAGGYARQRGERGSPCDGGEWQGSLQPAPEQQAEACADSAQEERRRHVRQHAEPCKRREDGSGGQIGSKTHRILAVPEQPGGRSRQGGKREAGQRFHDTEAVAVERPEGQQHGDAERERDECRTKPVDQLVGSRVKVEQGHTREDRGQRGGDCREPCFGRGRPEAE